MKEINVLIVVDVVSALASKDLGKNVYLIDTNKYFGSGSEGQEELVTACKDGQIVIWSVSPVNPGNNAEIIGFEGEAIKKNIINPRQTQLPGGAQIWSGRVESQGTSARYQYTCSLSFDGTPMKFDPYLKVSTD